jgi:hypothetical protein
VLQGYPPGRLGSSYGIKNYESIRAEIPEAKPERIVNAEIFGESPGEIRFLIRD